MVAAKQQRPKTLWQTEVKTVFKFCPKTKCKVSFVSFKLRCCCFFLVSLSRVGYRMAVLRLLASLSDVTNRHGRLLAVMPSPLAPNLTGWQELAQSRNNLEKFFISRINHAYDACSLDHIVSGWWGGAVVLCGAYAYMCICMRVCWPIDSPKLAPGCVYKLLTSVAARTLIRRQVS